MRIVSGPAAQNAYDVIVIGTGPIGQTVAERTRAAGLTVAAVERELVRGECSYWACIPSKAMLRPVDAPAVFKRRDGYVTDWHDDVQADWLKSIGAELIRGYGRLNGIRRVAVQTPEGGTVPLTARHAVVICTGSRPALPGLAGLDQVRPWTNRQATDSHTVPGLLAIVGGGGVGVEMASAWQGLGSQVTLLAPPSHRRVFGICQLQLAYRACECKLRQAERGRTAAAQRPRANCASCN